MGDVGWALEKVVGGVGCGVTFWTEVRDGGTDAKLEGLEVCNGLSGDVRE